MLNICSSSDVKMMSILYLAEFEYTDSTQGTIRRLINEVQGIRVTNYFLRDGAFVPDFEEIAHWWLNVLDNKERLRRWVEYKVAAKLPPDTKPNPALRIPVLALV